MKKTLPKRNQFEALRHIIVVECIPAIEVLEEVCKKEAKITKKNKSPYFLRELDYHKKSSRVSFVCAHHNNL